MKTFTALLLILMGNFTCAKAQEVNPTTKTIAVNVLGEVAKPSRYNLSSGAGALDALAVAGGTLRQASLKRAHILHHTDGEKPDDEQIDLQTVLNGGAKDVLLRDGDTLVIPERLY